MVRRFVPVIYLLLLSPLIAEYLLGSMPVKLLAALPVLMLMYGSGAVLIRESSLRLGGGAARLVLLAAAYGIIEEGWVTESLFNPDYLHSFHLRLLDFGFVPFLGTSPVWAVYVLTLHVAWSIAIPIGITESLFPAVRNQPWLGRIGLAVMAVLYLAGALLATRFTLQSEAFVAPAPNLIAVGVLAVLMVVAAVLWPRPVPAEDPAPIRPVRLCLVGVGVGSLFAATQLYGASLFHLGAATVVSILILCDVAVLAVVARATRYRPLGAPQQYGLALGGYAVYVWQGFITDYHLHGAGDLPGHAVLVVGMVVVAAVAAVRALGPAAHVSAGPA